MVENIPPPLLYQPKKPDAYRVDSSFFGYFDDLKNPGFKSCERVYSMDFSLSLEIKFLDILPKVYQIVSELKISFIYFV